MQMDLVFATAATAGKFPTYFVAVYVVGFIAAVSIGSLAWYNSKRPVGWEDAKRPDFIPDMKADNSANPDEQKS